VSARRRHPAHDQAVDARSNAGVQLGLWPVSPRPTPRPLRRSQLAVAAERPQEESASDAEPRAVWHGETQAFDVGTLKEVMLVRGFTAETLAQAAGVGRGTMYNALAGRSTRLSTARRILEALAAVEPRLLLSRFVAEG
jgi:hypothetical protein